MPGLYLFSVLVYMALVGSKNISASSWLIPVFGHLIRWLPIKFFEQQPKMLATASELGLRLGWRMY
jgi:hypothetical protein